VGEIGITVSLVIAVAAFGWLIFRVVGSLSAGSENAARADSNAAGALPGSEQIDSLVGRTRN
jgi:hypothetical protein